MKLYLIKNLTGEEFTKEISNFQATHQKNFLKARDKFYEYQIMLQEKEWKLEKEVDLKTCIGKLWSSSDKNSGKNAILRRIEINVPFKFACDFFKDEIKLTHLNNSFKGTKIVEDLGNDTFYVYQCFKGNFIISDRDFSLFKHCFTLQDGRFAIVSFSAVHPKIPKRKRIVRAHLDMSVYLLTKIDEKRTLCETIQNGDPKGYIPTVFVNNRIKKELEGLIAIKNYLEKTI